MVRFGELVLQCKAVVKEEAVPSFLVGDDLMRSLVQHGWALDENVMVSHGDLLTVPAKYRSTVPYYVPPISPRALFSLPELASYHLKLLLQLYH